MLRKSDKSWSFAEEKLLEDFVWDCLENTLDLIPLKRQFHIKGEYCDIIAKTRTNQIAILELKNCEDRYIIHQLTRYYHSLKLEQPFSELLDYSQPIRLIAIAPDFHRHNFIDRHYNTLKFEFIRFSIIEQADKFSLQFKLEGRKEIIAQQPIAFTKANNDTEIQHFPKS